MLLYNQIKSKFKVRFEYKNFVGKPNLKLLKMKNKKRLAKKIKTIDSNIKVVTWGAIILLAQIIIFMIIGSSNVVLMCWVGFVACMIIGFNQDSTRLLLKEKYFEQFGKEYRRKKTQVKNFDSIFPDQ